MGPEAVVIAEGVKFLLMLAFQEAQKAGLTTDQVMKLYLDEKAKFKANDPTQIPEVK